MATRDNHSDQIVQQALASVTIGSNTTTNGDIIDTADFDMGLKFAVMATAYTDGDFAISFEEGDDSGLSDATAVPEAKIIGTAKVLSAATVAGTPLLANGVFSNKRFVRIVVTSTSVTTGATLLALAVESGEYLPADT